MTEVLIFRDKAEVLSPWAVLNLEDESLILRSGAPELCAKNGVGNGVIVCYMAGLDCASTRSRLGTRLS